MEFSVQGDYLRLVNPELMAATIFSDLPSAEGLEWAKKLAPSQSAISFGAKLTYPGYKDIPVTYIKCTEDLILPPLYQQGAIDMIKSVGGDVTVEDLQSGHCPNISMPGEVIRLVRKAVENTV